MPITISYNNFSFTANATELQRVCQFNLDQEVFDHLKLLDCSYNPEMEV